MAKLRLEKEIYEKLLKNASEEGISPEAYLASLIPLAEKTDTSDRP